MNQPGTKTYVGLYLRPAEMILRTGFGIALSAAHNGQLTDADFRKYCALDPEPGLTLRQT